MSDASETPASVTEQVSQLVTDTTWIESLIPLGSKLLIAIAIWLIGFWVIGKIIKVIKRMMNLRQFDEALTGFLLAIISAVLKIVVLLAAIEQLGVDTTSLLAILGAAGLAVGLALKDSLSNFAAGVMLIIFKPFKIGDFVEAGGVAGVVEKIAIFNTIFRSPDNKEIIVPNSQVYGGTIVNVSAKPTRRVDMIFGISYDDDMKKARQLMLDVINADERVLKEPEVVIAVNELADSSVNFVVRPWVNSPDYWAVKWDLTEKIKDSFDNNGITIPYPQQDVYMHQVEK